MYWWTKYEVNSSWWPPAPPNRDVVLEEMKSEAMGLTRIAPAVEPSTMIRTDKSHLELARTVLDM